MTFHYTPFNPEKDAAIRAANQRRNQLLVDRAEAEPIPGAVAPNPTDEGRYDWAGKPGFDGGRMPDGSHFTIGSSQQEVSPTPEV